MTDTASAMAEIIATLAPDAPACQRCVELEAELAPWRAMERLRAAQLARRVERDAMSQTTTIHH